MPADATTRKPDDIAAPNLSPDDCFTWGEESEFGIQSNRARATAIDNFAREYGIRFQDVVCRRRYMRMLTRQESYDARAADERADAAVWDWADNHEPPLKYDSAFRFVDADGKAYEPPAFDGTVPDSWEPDEDDPVWEFCERATPGAIACWQLEER